MKRFSIHRRSRMWCLSAPAPRTRAPCGAPQASSRAGGTTERPPPAAWQLWHWWQLGQRLTALSCGATGNNRASIPPRLRTRRWTQVRRRPSRRTLGRTIGWRVPYGRVKGTIGWRVPYGRVKGTIGWRVPYGRVKGTGKVREAPTSLGPPQRPPRVRPCAPPLRTFLCAQGCVPRCGPVGP
jgi:hypothetical protein